MVSGRPFSKRFSEPLCVAIHPLIRKMFSVPHSISVLVLTLLLGALLPGDLASQQRESPSAPTDTTRIIPIDPVVVSVNHLELLRSRVPNSVSVVTREDIIESGAPSVLSVVSERVPGLFVTQRGVLGYGVGQGAAGRISIRGVGANPNTQVLVMTDGRPQMMGLFGHPIADTHVSSGVERVEVIRGPASVLYGTSAMGGVVNVITRRRWNPGSAVEAAASYGSFATERQEVSLEYGLTEQTGVLIAGNRYRTDGHRPNAAFAIDNLTVRGSSQLRPGLVLIGDGAVSDLRSNDPGPITAPRVNNWVDIRRGTTGLSLENRGGRVSGATKLFLNFGRHEIYDGFYSLDQTIGLQLHQGLLLYGGSTLTVGADIKRFGGEAENRTSGMNWGSHDVDERGVYAVLHQPLPLDAVATGGLRLNHHSVYGTELAPQLGAALPLTAWTTVRASSARGFRSPTIRELYLFPAPTPDLQPERAWNNEISVLQSFGRSISLEAAVFRNQGSNLIRTTGRFPNLTLSNTGEFVHRGAELALNVSPFGGMDLSVSYGYLDSGETTLAHPEHQLHGSARYAFGNMTAHFGIQHVAGIHAADGAEVRLPDYTVANGRVATTVHGNVSVYVAGENLFGETYQVIAGYPMPGRVLSIGAFIRGR
ncbi:TonB-dependent receptor [soil metagenome]